MDLDYIWRGRSLRIAVGVVVLVVVVLVAGDVDAATLIVDNSGDADYTIVQTEVVP